MGDGTIDETTLRRLASLAGLSLDATELKQMSLELTRIVAHIDMLAAVDLEGVAPTAHVSVAQLATRADEVSASLPQQQALGQAPHTQGPGFAVPSYVDEG